MASTQMIFIQWLTSMQESLACVGLVPVAGMREGELTRFKSFGIGQ